MAQVYVDSTAMEDWKSQMEKINNDCVASIEEIEAAIKSLTSSFQGSYADSYTDSFSSFTNKVKESHQAMSDFSGFLNTIVNIMNGQ